VKVVRARWQLRAASVVGSARVIGRVKVINRGTMTIGDRVNMEGTAVRIELVCLERATLTIGDGTYINYGTNISATDRVSIGRDCAIGQYSIIMDNDYHRVGDHRQMGAPAPIEIGDNVWLGARVIVLRGASIGEGAVIGANSVVKGHIPPHSLAAGSPARVIRDVRSGP
jgi:acetyltransferase-like isoleucine patch superfamily enzyme